MKGKKGNLVAGIGGILIAIGMFLIGIPLVVAMKTGNTDKYLPLALIGVCFAFVGGILLSLTEKGH